MTKNIKVLSLMRSGHHAIMDWISKSFFEPVVFNNDCKFDGNNLIYGPFSKTYNTYGDLDFYCSINKIINKPVFFKKNVCDEILIEKNSEKINNNLFFIDDKENLIKIGCVISSMEDAGLEEFDKFLETDNEVPSKPIPLIVIRDAFNLVASRIMGKCIITEKIINNWKEQARLHLSGDDKYIFILYNKWLIDEEYRNEILKKICIEKNFNINYLEENKIGYSSFKSFFEDEKPDKIQLQSRWRFFIDDKDYLNIFIKDKELCELSKNIFGTDFINDTFEKIESIKKEEYNINKYESEETIKNLNKIEENLENFKVK